MGESVVSTGFNGPERRAEMAINRHLSTLSFHFGNPRVSWLAEMANNRHLSTLSFHFGTTSNV